eukprot:1159326-Pelagomonas_calceolata.AAC.7
MQAQTASIEGAEPARGEEVGVAGGDAFRPILQRLGIPLQVCSQRTRGKARMRVQAKLKEQVKDAKKGNDESAGKGMM